MPKAKLKTRKRKLKPNVDTVRVTMTLPEKTYIVLKDFAKEDIRSISREARYLMEIGMSVVAQQNGDEDEIVPELEPQIGFVVERNDDYEDDDD